MRAGCGLGMWMSLPDREANMRKTPDISRNSWPAPYNDYMVARLEKIERGYAVLLTPEMVEELHLVEGSPVQILPVAAERTVRYASAEEFFRVHKELEPENAVAYRELAK